MKEFILNNIEDIKIFLDPFRMKILKTIKNNKTPMTVKEIADNLEMTPANVHYHVKKLEAIGVLEIKHTKEINGIIAKYYDFTADTITFNTEDVDKNVVNSLKPMFANGLINFFDDAKQNLINIMNLKEKSIGSTDIYISSSKTHSFDPEKVSDLFNEIHALVEKYEYTGEDAVKYNTFYSIIKEVK